MNRMKTAWLTALCLTTLLAGCDQWSGQSTAQAPFNNGLRQDWSQPTTCSPADSTCGSGIGNPSVQSPVQKREQNVTPN